jgi:hypothetical protein
MVDEPLTPTPVRVVSSTTERDHDIVPTLRTRRHSLHIHATRTAGNHVAIGAERESTAGNGSGYVP